MFAIVLSTVVGLPGPEFQYWLNCNILTTIFEGGRGRGGRGSRVVHASIVPEVRRRVSTPRRQQPQAAIVEEQAATRQVRVAQQPQQSRLGSARLCADHCTGQAERVALVLDACAIERFEVFLDLCIKIWVIIKRSIELGKDLTKQKSAVLRQMTQNKKKTLHIYTMWCRTSKTTL